MGEGIGVACWVNRPRCIRIGPSVTIRVWTSEPIVGGVPPNVDASVRSSGLRVVPDPIPIRIVPLLRVSWEDIECGDVRNMEPRPRRRPHVQPCGIGEVIAPTISIRVIPLVRIIRECIPSLVQPQFREWFQIEQRVVTVPVSIRICPLLRIIDPNVRAVIDGPFRSRVGVPVPIVVGATPSVHGGGARLQRAVVCEVRVGDPLPDAPGPGDVEGRVRPIVPEPVVVGVVPLGPIIWELVDSSIALVRGVPTIHVWVDVR